MTILYDVLLFPLNIQRSGPFPKEMVFFMQKGGQGMKKKKKTNLDYFILNQKWAKRFLISHISGWIVACLQTIWIVVEIRCWAKKIMKQVKK